jgi:hypothetical protein
MHFIGYTLGEFLSTKMLDERALLEKPKNFIHQYLAYLLR